MNLPKPHFFGLLAGLFLSAGLVLSAMLVTRAWLRIYESQTVTVTGAARKNVRADLVVWRGSFSAESFKLPDAQRTLKADAAKVEAFLKDSGITEFAFSPIRIEELRERNYESNTQPLRLGYKLSQTVTIQSADVEKILRLDGETAALVERGVVFTSQPPDFIYTRAGETKIEMLAEATGDARARAEQIAGQGGRGIARLRNARMGVFQIGPLHSTATSWEGCNDTTSLDKTITAVVSATFSLK